MSMWLGIGLYTNSLVDIVHLHISATGIGALFTLEIKELAKSFWVKWRMVYVGLLSGHVKVCILNEYLKQV